MAPGKQMDPDRYQMKDIKRRLSATERHSQRIEASYMRFRLRAQARLKLIEDHIKPLGREEE